MDGDYKILTAYSDDDEEILYEAEKGYFFDDGELKLVHKENSI